MAPRAPTGERPKIVGPDNGPEDPFPIFVSGPVIQGFGRGSKELGIPTANIPLSGLSVGGHSELESGIYYGWAGLNLTSSGEIISTSTSSSSSLAGAVFPAVLSLGYNPFYANTVRSLEVHLLHEFPQDFYGSRMNLCILGYIRPEYDYAGVDALVEDIKLDIEVARRGLKREAYGNYKAAEYLLKFEGKGHEEAAAT